MVDPVVFLTESVVDVGVPDSVDDDVVSDLFITVALVLLVDSAYPRREPNTRIVHRICILVHTLLLLWCLLIREVVHKKKTKKES